jgi:hypothetical protein
MKEALHRIDGFRERVSLDVTTNLIPKEDSHAGVDLL